MRRNSLRQTWSPTSGSMATTPTTARRRRARQSAKSKRRRRLVVVLFGFVLAWMWIVMSVVSWISSGDSKPSLGSESQLRRRENDDQTHRNSEPTTDDDGPSGRLGPTTDKGIQDASNKNHKKQFDDTAFHRYTEMAPHCDPIEASDVDFTLVTQLSNDRLWMMRHHCDRWGRLMSVAVLTNRTHEQVLEELIEELGCDSTQLSLQVLSATLFPQDEYPVNVLRNLALSKVTTSHVMYADIDFWESQDLFDILHLPQVRQHLAESHKHALVVPAFQLNRQCREWRECPEKNIPKMPRTRDEMLKLLANKHGYPFDPTNKGGHGSSLYASWVKKQTEPGSLIPIPCVYSNRYEPYLAFRYCRDLPPFQEAFSGYGKNKMTMTMHMIRSGYRFHQLGVGFLVHYPHLDSKSRMEWNESPQAAQPKKINGKWLKNKPEAIDNVDWTAYKRGRVDATFVQFRKWLAREVPDESVLHKCSNAEDDDARLWYDRSQQ